MSRSPNSFHSVALGPPASPTKYLLSSTKQIYNIYIYKVKEGKKGAKEEKKRGEKKSDIKEHGGKVHSMVQDLPTTP